MAQFSVYPRVPGNVLGQKVMANSAPVVIASDQSAIHSIVDSSALPTGASTSAKQDTGNTSLASIDTNIAAKLSGSLVPFAFDYVSMTYVAAGNGLGQVQTATYKTGGAAGTTVATLTLAYDASNNISSVTKS